MKDSIFGLFYTMCEGKDDEVGVWRYRWTMLSLLLDWLQVLRSMTHPTFGWNGVSTGTMKVVDLVYFFISIVQNVIPAWIFYILAMILSMVAIFDAAYVTKLFRDGHVKIFWPLKLLRALVASIVTVFFTTLLEFLLWPVNCVGSEDDSHLSAAFHGSGSPCDPWGVPEVAISSMSIAVAVVYSLFSMGTTFLNFEMNPISTHPLAACTGRVEALWTLCKVAPLCLVYLSDTISEEGVSIVLILINSAVMFLHFQMMPFHDYTTNMVRGGIYLSTTWFAGACLIVKIAPDSPTLQWGLIVVVAVSFVLGCAAVHFKQKSMMGYLQLLRSHWNALPANHAAARGKMRNTFGRLSSQESRRSSLTLPNRSPLTSRSTYDKFFDAEWTGQRAFPTGTGAFASLRLLLTQRNEEDVPFLASLLAKSITEHPKSQDLIIFQLLVLRYVCRDRSQASAQERLTKLNNSSLAMDRSFILFAISKRSEQDGASAAMGKGTVSAVNLIEYDSKMEKATRNHHECIAELKAFWKTNATTKHQEKQGADLARNMINHLEAFDRARSQAVLEYGWLLEKYPSSVSLLRSYSSFCDSVLNDHIKAEQYRQQASLLEESAVQIEEAEPTPQPGGAVEEENKETGSEGMAAGEEGAGKSVSSAESEPHRVQMARFCQSWREIIMGAEVRMLRRLQWRVRVAVAIVIVLSAAGFAITDFVHPGSLKVLFNDVALKNIDLIDMTGRFRLYTSTAAFLAREQMIASFNNDSDAWTQSWQKMEEITDEMQEQHAKSYNAISSSVVFDFYNRADMPIQIPTRGGWRKVNQSYWVMGSDFARRAHVAGHCSMTDYLDPNFDLPEIGQAKRSVAYLHENVFRYIMPAFENAVKVYEDEVSYFGWLATLLVSINVTVNSLLVLAISYSVLRALQASIQNVQYKLVSCSLALKLPRRVVRKVYTFYSEVEADLHSMLDEAQARDALMQQDTAGDDPAAKPWVAEPEESGKQRRRKGRKTASKDSEGSSDTGGGVYPPTNVEPRLAIGGSEVTLPLTIHNLQQHIEDETSFGPGRIRRQVGSPFVLSGPHLTDDQEKEEEEEEDADVGDAHGGELQDEDMKAEEEESEDDSEMEEAPSAAGAGEEERAGRGSEGAESADEAEESEESLGQCGVGLGAVVLVGRPNASPPAASDADLAAGTPARDGDRDREGVGEEELEQKGQGEGEVCARGASSQLSGVSPGGIRRTSVSSDGKGVAEEGEAGRGRRRRGSQRLRFETEGAQAAEGEGSGAGGATSMLGAFSGSFKRMLLKGLGDSQASSLRRWRSPSNGRSPVRAGARKEGDCVATGLAAREVDEQVLQSFKRALKGRQPWYNKSNVYAAALSMMLGLCMFSVLYPARLIPDLVNLAPSTNLASARRTYVRAIAHLSRELVLDDNMSRMSLEETAGTLKQLLDELREIDYAIRLGNARGITVGADYRSREHNRVMYEVGCPWREDPDDDCLLPADTYPHAAMDGLSNLMLYFLDSVDNILAYYGPPKDTFKSVYNVVEDPSVRTKEAHGKKERIKLLTEDVDLRFVKLAFDGDLYAGTGHVMQLFKDETAAVLNKVHMENQLLFCLYIFQVLFVFYLWLFVRTMKMAGSEACKAKAFVGMIPMHALETSEANTVKDYFTSEPEPATA